MPTLPLYISPSCSNAWHRVIAPGGYERWHFDAEDAAGDTRIVIGFFDGVTFDGKYQRRYRAYRRRPTRNVPPTAREYPGVHVAVSRAGKTLLDRVLRYPAGAFEGSVEEARFNVGRNGVTRGDAGEYRMKLEDRESGLAANFRFVPTARHEEGKLALARKEGGGEQFWVIGAPMCEVSGAIRVGSAEEIQFTGPGYHDHHYGSAPIAYGLRRWMRGRALLEDRAIMFEVVEARDQSAPIEARVMEADARGMREIGAQRWEVGNSRRQEQEVSYPERMGCEAMRLSEPRVIGAESGALWLTYAARLNDGRVTTALCEIAG